MKGGEHKGDGALRAAGLTRADLAIYLGVSTARAGQICRGEGTGYEQADKVARYINCAAGKRVCGCDEFMARPKYLAKRKATVKSRGLRKLALSQAELARDN